MSKSISAPGVKGTKTELSLLQMTWPIWLEQLLIIFMGNADTFMLSYISDSSVAAVAIANQFIFLSILILRTVSAGTQVLLSQHVGGGRHSDASRIMAVSLVLHLVIGLVVSAGLVLLREPLIRMISRDPQVEAEAGEYLLIVGGFLFTQTVIQALSLYLRVYGWAKETMWVTIGMNVINVAGNTLFIFGPVHQVGMEVWGVAVSTSISRFVALGVLVWMAYRMLPWDRSAGRLLAFRGGDLRPMLRVGLPAMVETMTYHLVQTLFLAFIGLMGTSALAARQYAFQLITFVSLFSSSMSASTSILVGWRLGRADYSSAYRQALTSIKWCLICTLGAYTLLLLFRYSLLELFTKDPDVLEVGSLLIVIGLLIELGRSVTMITIGSLRAAGDGPFTVWIGLLTMVGISLPVGYGLSVGLAWGAAGVFVAIALDECLRGAAVLVRWRRRRWEQQAAMLRPSTEARLEAAASGEAASGAKAGSFLP